MRLATTIAAAAVHNTMASEPSEDRRATVTARVDM
jgi:hypothetical protein